jgi:rhodanese-related sulfurtransferase
MRSFIYTCLCLTLLGENLLIGVNAADKGVVDKQAALKIITAPEVKEKLGKKDVFLVNSLTNIEYDIQHIPGSINIPLHDMDNSNLLPDNKHSTLIFYCMGGRCLYSRKASLKAIKLGYKNVFWFEGGIPDWYRFNYPMSINHQLKSISVKKLSPASIVDLLKQQSIFILDVKPEWWSSNEGAIKGSVHMPLVKLQHAYKQLPKGKAIIITDGLMRQSPSAARFLINKGYQVLGVLKGGITRWEKEGYPVIKK